MSPIYTRDQWSVFMARKSRLVVLALFLSIINHNVYHSESRSIQHAMPRLCLRVRGGQEHRLHPSDEAGISAALPAKDVVNDDGVGVEGEQARKDGDNAEQEEDYEGFPALRAEDGEVLSVDGLCMSCGKSGTTKILPATIPRFGRIIVMAFECTHCGLTNNEVQSAADIQSHGSRFKLKVSSAQDLDRQVIRSCHATVCIPELELEMPASSQGAVLTTVEGLLSRIVLDLEGTQTQREERDPQQAHAVQGVIDRLKAFAAGSEEFSLVIDDPSGNSFIEGPAMDPYLEATKYVRTHAQNEYLGMVVPKEEEREIGHHPSEAETPPRLTNPLLHEPTSEVIHTSYAGDGGSRTVSNQQNMHWGEGEQAPKFMGVQLDREKEVDSFGVECPACKVSGLEKMYLTSIPHFGEVLIMAFCCDECGYRDSQVKPGDGDVLEHGVRLELTVSEPEDWNRMVLKSRSCTISIPEVQLKLEAGTLGALITSVEGLINMVFEHLQSTHPFSDGDSAESNTFAVKFREFVARLKLIQGKSMEFQLILDDPLGVSKIEPLAMGGGLNPDMDTGKEGGGLREFFSKLSGKGKGKSHKSVAPLGDTRLTSHTYVRPAGVDEEWGLQDSTLLPHIAGTEDDPLLMASLRESLPQAGEGQPAGDEDNGIGDEQLWDGVD